MPLARENIFHGKEEIFFSFVLFAVKNILPNHFSSLRVAQNIFTRHGHLCPSWFHPKPMPQEQGFELLPDIGCAHHLNCAGQTFAARYRKGRQVRACLENLNDIRLVKEFCFYGTYSAVFYPITILSHTIQQAKAMNGIGNVASARFECSICNEDGYTRGQSGEFALVKTSCPTRDVFHLKCITGWLDRQNVKLDERKCICSEKALPLIRMNNKRQLEDESPYCETEITNYCRNGNLPDLKALLSQDETLVNRDYHSVTSGHREHLLAVAIKEKQNDLVGFLINFGADVNAAGHDGEPPLHIAARLRRTDDFNMLIDAGADINKLLLFAIQKNETQLLEYLISTKSNPAKLNSALYEAVSQGQTQCLEPLVKMGANDFNAALREAAEQGQTQCLKPLINAGANDLDGALREAARWGETQCLELLLDEGAKDFHGALYIAILKGHSEIRKVLISKGADITTVLGTPDRQDTSMGAFISLIISRYINATDEKGTTPLHIAAAMGHPKWLKKQIETGGVDANATDCHGSTALRLAACCGHTEAVKVLLNSPGKQRIQVNAKDSLGNTALHVAVWNNHIKTVKVLVSDRGINVNEKNKNGWTALHLAARNGYTEIVKELVSASGINVNEKDIEGSTALHEAARYASPETVKELLSVSGIKVNEKDIEGWTALDLAWMYGPPENKKLLEDKGAVYNVKACVIQ